MATVLTIPAMRMLRFQAVEAFPTSLSAIHLAGLSEHLDSGTVARLQEIEEQVAKVAPLEPILRAQTAKQREDLLLEALPSVSEYYVESGIIIWRSLHHDYGKLLHLSNVSSKAVEDAFFGNANRLEPDVFVSTVAGVRIVGKVGEWIISSEQKKGSNEQILPLKYLSSCIVATFLVSCLLAYVTGKVKRARVANLRELAKTFAGIAEEVYFDAIEASVHKTAGEKQHWYWSPEWQEGEVEADLDRHLGNVKRFDSAEDMVRALRGHDS